jgi:hypothetical protein
MDVKSNLATVIFKKIVFIIGILFTQIISFYTLMYFFSNFDIINKSTSFRLDFWNMLSNEFYPILYWLFIWNIISGFLIFISLIFIFENFKPLMKWVFYLIIIGQVIFFMWSLSVSMNFGIAMAATALPPVFAALTRLRGWW